MKGIFIIFILMMITFPLSTHADSKNTKTLDRAFMNVLDQNYKTAIGKTKTLLDSLALNSIDEIVLAHQILSLSYCETGDMSKAADHIKALRAFSPNADFDAFNPSVKCKSFLSLPQLTSIPQDADEIPDDTSPPVTKKKRGKK